MKKYILTLIIVVASVVFLCIMVACDAGNKEINNNDYNNTGNDVVEITSEQYIDMLESRGYNAQYKEEGFWDIPPFINVITTDAMKPTIDSGDVLVVNKYSGDGSDLKVGQVIIIRRNMLISGNIYDVYNVRRILKIETYATGVYIRTRADNQYDANGNWLDWHDYVDNLENANLDTSPIYNIEDVVAVWGDVDDELNFTPGELVKSFDDNSIEWVIDAGYAYIVKFINENVAKAISDSVVFRTEAISKECIGDTMVFGYPDVVTEIIDFTNETLGNT